MGGRVEEGGRVGGVKGGGTIVHKKLVTQMST